MRIISTSPLNYIYWRWRFYYDFYCDFMTSVFDASETPTMTNIFCNFV